MTIGAIIVLIIIILCGIGITVFCAFCGKEASSSTGKAVAYGSMMLTVILTVAISAVFIWYRTTSASGQRALKDQQSNLSGGIERTVSVYDINGEIIEQYTGRFDIETDRNSYILFDDEQGKRHMIYYTTATIIIDEQ